MKIFTARYHRPASLIFVFLGTLLIALPVIAEDEKPAPPKEVLDSTRVPEIAKLGYTAAKACPEIIAKLFCYCGCDLTETHTSLLDCFTSNHGVTCSECKDEAILANKLKKEGLNFAQIQKAVDEKFSKLYPFEQDSAAYKKYKSTRLWVSSGAVQKDLAGTRSAASEKQKDTTVAKLKPGRVPGKCCSGDEHSKKDSKKDQK